MFNLVIEYWYFYIKACFKIIFKQRVKKLQKTYRSINISVDSTEQDIIVIYIPVIIAKKNQIHAQGLKNSNCIIENLPIDCEFSTMERSSEWHP